MSLVWNAWYPFYPRAERYIQHIMPMFLDLPEKVMVGGGQPLDILITIYINYYVWALRL